MRTPVVISAFAIALLSMPGRAQNVTPEMATLARIRAAMAENLQRQPNYTCLETVDRSSQQKAGDRLEDTVRLEVALVDGKEMFAWPGSTEFQDTEISKLITSGMFGNGNFGTYARALFTGRGPAFSYKGESTKSGRPLLRYDFLVPKIDSGYHLRASEVDAIVGFHGSIYADRESLDLQRMEVIADDIPRELGLVDVNSSMDYARVVIGDEPFLLPVGSTLTMRATQLSFVNRIRFVQCRKFTGESSLVDGDFDDPASPDLKSSAAKPVEIREVVLPRGLSLQLNVKQKIDLQKASVGDSVIGSLASDLRQGKLLLAPKGAVAKGRILRMDRMDRYFYLRLQFTDLEWPGGHATLKLAMDQPGLSITPPPPRNSVLRIPEGGDITFVRPYISRLDSTSWFWKTIE